MSIRSIWPVIPAAGLAVVIHGVAAASTIDDLATRLTKLEAENTMLRQRVLILEQTIARQTANPDQTTPAQTTTSAAPILLNPARQSDSPPHDADQSRHYWDGVYLGLGAGYANGRSRGYEFLYNEFPTSQPIAGGFGDIHIGGDIEIQRMVVGLEFSGELGDEHGNQTIEGTPGQTNAINCFSGSAGQEASGGANSIYSCKAKRGATFDFTSRLGYTFLDDHLLLYFKGGISDSTLSLKYNIQGIDPDIPEDTFYATSGSRKNLIGAVFGVGFEFLSSEKVSYGLEYNVKKYSGDAFDYGYNYNYYNVYSPYGGRTIGSQITSASIHNLSDQTVKIFVNYRPFGR